MSRHRLVHVVLGLAVAVVATAAGVVGCEMNPGRPPSANPALPPPAPLADLVLLITGSTSGNLEPCNCPGQPRGGLSRRQTAVESLRAGREHFVLLDSGNLLDLRPDTLSDTYMLSGYRLLNYDAIAVGDQELDRGPARFAGLARSERLPIVATNVSLKGQPLGATHRMIERGGRRVVVMSVVGPGMLAFSGPEVRRQITVADPVDSVLLTLAELETQAAGGRPDMVVVLANLSPTERDYVVGRLGEVGVDLAVVGTDQDREVRLERFGTTPAVFSPAAGRQIAVVGVRFAGPGAMGDSPIAYAYGCPVEQTLPRDKRLWELYQAYTFDAHQRMLTLLGKIGAVRYVGSDQCGECHVTQYEAWRAHQHGRAWATIVREGRTLDPDCMRCHTVGFGFEGGFRSAELTPRLADVGCQNCHQIDLDRHTAAELPRTEAKVDPDVCLHCHTDAKSPNFDAVKRLPDATCPKGPAVEPRKDAI